VFGRAITSPHLKKQWPMKKVVLAILAMIVGFFTPPPGSRDWEG
jgi:hypothetical protein